MIQKFKFKHTFIIRVIYLKYVLSVVTGWNTFSRLDFRIKQKRHYYKENQAILLFDVSKTILTC